MNQRTLLYDKHVELGAKMVPFGGFELPIQYGSVKEEALAVRNQCGMFDVSHMGEFYLEGPGAVEFVDHIITNDFAGAETAKAVYSPLCREDGTVIDDLIAYKLGPQKVGICVNAANIEKDWQWISARAEELSSRFEFKIRNQSGDYNLLAVQGPKTESIFKELGLIDDSEFDYYRVRARTYKGLDILVARTGYTGEDGFEVFIPGDGILALWDDLIGAGVRPCGLAARDVLRLEVCYPLYGHELGDHLTPYDANLKWTVKMAKPDFIGKNSLEGYTSKYRLVKLSLEKGIPREGYKILNGDEQEIGVVTSGTMSVTLGKGICMGLVERSRFPESKKFKIAVRKNNFEATYHAKAFVTGGHK
ncbi:MAG: glycine cleavage system aminomethyltransferase GcvT [Halobacteriovoraceae bacterium]|jgi:aminomethyltransferase|nr:glycine cleavage system aminomethyltransferase GcvT [Halobacteriovoraceae bacterium]